MRPYLIPLVLICTLSACANPPEVEADLHKVSFVCDRGQNLDVVFRGENAQVMGKDFSLRLEQQVSGSGIRYAGEGYELRGKGPQITLTAPDGEALQCRDQEWAMQQPQIQPPAPTLTANSWQLRHLRTASEAIIPPSVEAYRLEFATDGRFHMQLDCNRLNGQWQATPAGGREGALSLTGGAMTRAMCQPDALDTRIARDITQIKTFSIVGDVLTLPLSDGSGEYVWERAQ